MVRQKTVYSLREFRDVLLIGVVISHAVLGRHREVEDLLRGERLVLGAGCKGEGQTREELLLTDVHDLQAVDGLLRAVDEVLHPVDGDAVQARNVLRAVLHDRR